MAPDVTDPLAVILAGGSLAISSLLGLVLKLISSRWTHVEKEQKEQGNTVNTLWRGMTDITRRMETAESRIQGTLTRELFEERTNNQDRKLDKIEEKLEYVDQVLSDRPSREMPPMRPKLPSRR